MKSAFTFEVTSKGVFINIDHDIEFVKLKESLLNHVSEASDFFAGVDMYINLNNRNFTLTQMEEIIEIVKNYESVENTYLVNQKNQTDTSTDKDTILIKRTIRSGQRVKYPTNVVIIGDINPGAVVIAGGDVIVLGKLKGVVHAGAGGSNNAYVFALKLQPTQLRIGSIISRPPDENTNNNVFNPEKAFIKDGTIVVEKLTI